MTKKVTVKLTKEQRLATNATSPDKYRTILRGVHISNRSITATDGSIIIKKIIEYRGKQKITLSGKQLGSLKAKGGVEMEINSNEVIAHYDRSTMAVDYIQGNYPFDKATKNLKKPGKPPYKIFLNGNSLKKLLSTLGKNENLIEFSFYDPEQPIILDISTMQGEPIATGAIMPLHVEH